MTNDKADSRIEKSLDAITADDFGTPADLEAFLAATPVVPGRIVCPYCRGVSRNYVVDEVGEPCFTCREDGYLDPGDDGYPATDTEP